MSLFVLGLILLAVAGGARGQVRDVGLVLGLEGEIVSDRWNPMRLLLRDQAPATLEITIDQGSLRDGQQLIAYRRDLSGGTGVIVLEDDIYIPSWRSLSWSLSRSDRVVASGSISPRARDGRPLDLVVSATPGRWRSMFPEDARLVEVAAGSLPLRAAAYDGIRVLLIDGTGAAPRLQALAAAAAAGVDVIALTDLPPSHGEIDLIAPGGSTRLGSGWLHRVGPTEIPELVAALPPRPDEGLVRVLVETLEAKAPEHPPQLTMLILAGFYGVTALLLVRFGGVPGLFASLALVLFASIAGWGFLRPAAAEFRTGLQLELGAGELARQVPVLSLLRLPAGPVVFDAPLRPLTVRSYDTGFDRTSIHLQRGSRETLLGRPQVAPAVLRWQAGQLVNAGGVPLFRVQVKGLGPQPALAPRSALEPASSEETSLEEPFRSLLAWLPEGAALATDGRSILIALPPAPEGGL